MYPTHSKTSVIQLIVPNQVGKSMEDIVLESETYKNSIKKLKTLNEFAITQKEESENILCNHTIKHIGKLFFNLKFLINFKASANDDNLSSFILKASDPKIYAILQQMQQMQQQQMQQMQQQMQQMQQIQTQQIQQTQQMQQMQEQLQLSDARNNSLIIKKANNKAITIPTLHKSLKSIPKTVSGLGQYPNSIQLPSVPLIGSSPTVTLSLDDKTPVGEFPRTITQVDCCSKTNINSLRSYYNEDFGAAVDCNINQLRAAFRLWIQN